jgi:pyruvate,water dikinase
MEQKSAGHSILWFSEVHKEDVPLVGGKGANLGEMTNAGLPVPPGFIITAGAYFDYLKATGIDAQIAEKLEGLNVEDSKDLQARAEDVQKLIVATPLPEQLKKEIVESYHKLKEDTKTENLYVAVRSSATAEDLADASFAGQQATYLNIIGDEEVLVAVLKCWASLFEARAIYYRDQQGFDQLSVGIAVPVQKMVNSDAAGVMFTIDPVTNDMDHVSIEAAYGLGEVVVLGAITPDRYLIDKNTGEISGRELFKQTWKLTRESGSSDTDKLDDLAKAGTPVPDELQEKQKISDEEIMKLYELANKIEAHYGKPQDTEWAIENGEVYMVQSRPITTLGEKKEGNVEGQDISKATVILKGSAASTGMAGGPVKIIHSPSEIDQILDGDVLVTEMTTPDYVPAMKRASAIVTDAGGRTCHAAIVSRELGIPCVVGTGTATKDLKDVDYITVDGRTGVVYKGKIEMSKQEQSGAMGSTVVEKSEPVTATRIYVNLGEPEMAAQIAAKNVDGVGLLRAEFIIMEHIKEHPHKMYDEGRQQEFIDKLAEGLETFAREFYPRPVIYRATDFKTNEYRNLPGGEKYEPQEENPMIGYRGCFRYLKEPELFAMELEAIKKVRQQYDNLHLMIPFVRRVDEFLKVKEQVEAAGLKRSNDFKLWIMVEVPSSVILIDKFCEAGIDGISIGSNDLTQLTLGLDRDSSIVAEEYDERNEAVQILIKRTIEVCREHGVTASICGQAPSVYPEISEKLVEYGVTSISVNPDMIEQTRRLVASVEEKLVLRELSEVRHELSEVEDKLKENNN